MLVDLFVNIILKPITYVILTQRLIIKIFLLNPNWKLKYIKMNMQTKLNEQIDHLNKYMQVIQRE